MRGPLFLVGFMGAGKSTIGRLLAQKCCVPFVDLDEEIVCAAGESIASIFATRGEIAFRDLEESTLMALAPDPQIVATGGGIVGRDANWQHMQRVGTTLYLDSSWETLVQRLSGSRERPLLQTPEGIEGVHQLWLNRQPLYRQADYCILTDHKTPEAIVGEIRMCIKDFV
ncbi:MAG: shikimate kinase [Desulfuromonas sp.]|nr:MAG: shikimate kinase [Desulfuromonas sp.]